MLSTNHVVLGLLRERPGYGYELLRRLDDRLDFLDLSFNTVYRALDRLERDGLIAEVGVKAVGGTRRGAPRMTYEITAEGNAQFDHWMAAQSGAAVIREELHAKIVLSDTPDLSALVAQTIVQERACLAELAGLRRTSLEHLLDEQVAWSAVSTLLVDEHRAVRLQGTIDWLQRARTVLERRVVQHERRS